MRRTDHANEFNFNMFKALVYIGIRHKQGKHGIVKLP